MEGGEGQLMNRNTVICRIYTCVISIKKRKNKFWLDCTVKVLLEFEFWWKIFGKFESFLNPQKVKTFTAPAKKSRQKIRIWINLRISECLLLTLNRIVTSRNALRATVEFRDVSWVVH